MAPPYRRWGEGLLSPRRPEMHLPGYRSRAVSSCTRHPPVCTSGAFIIDFEIRDLVVQMGWWCCSEIEFTDKDVVYGLLDHIEREA